eukprot:1144235-Pelagomonas_calceolata.AAC.1
MAEFCISPTTGSYHSISFAMIFIWYKYFKSPISRFGAVGGQIWSLVVESRVHATANWAWSP